MHTPRVEAYLVAIQVTNKVQPLTGGKSLSRCVGKFLKWGSFVEETSGVSSSYEERVEP